MAQGIMGIGFKAIALYVFISIVLVLPSVVPVSAGDAGLVRIELKKRPYDQNNRIAARLESMDARLSGVVARRYSLCGENGLRDSDSDGDIILLKNYLDAQYYGEISIGTLPL